MSVPRFCTYCDRGYAARLLGLHESLLAQGEAFVLYVLCFDREVEQVVKAAAAPSLVAITLAELQRADPAYAAVQSQRSPVDYFFTTTPVLVAHCLERDAAADGMTYLDADLFFFGPASTVFAEQDGASVGIVPHRFPPHLKVREQYGIYNVAWVSFRRDEAGLACLAWWRERCLEWCHDRLDNGRFADQGYLDEFPRRFGKVKVLHHPGINAAPWNMAGVAVTRQDGQVQVDGRRLLFYHFQGIREVSPGWFEPGVSAYQTPLTTALRDLVYRPYLEQLVRKQRQLRRKHGLQPKISQPRLNAGGSTRDRWERFKARWVLPFYGRLQRRLIHCAEPETD